MSIEQVMRNYSKGLELTVGAQTFLRRLLSIDWSYPMSDSNVVYREEKKKHTQLLKVVNEKQGVYKELYQRVLERKWGK